MKRPVPDCTDFNRRLTKHRLPDVPRRIDGLRAIDFGINGSHTNDSPITKAASAELSPEVVDTYMPRVFTSLRQPQCAARQSPSNRAALADARHVKKLVV